jgi:hypothetical protein
MRHPHEEVVDFPHSHRKATFGKWGESEYAVRTAFEEAWRTFLRDFKLWCASEEARLLTTQLPMR